MSKASDLTDQPATAHTPSPWFIVEDDDAQSRTIQTSPDKYALCDTVATAWGGGSVPVEANARLIAASPEMAQELRIWGEMFGAALVLAMQGDYSEVDRLAHDCPIHFPNGAPSIKSLALATAEGRE